MIYHYSILGSLRIVRSEMEITDLDVVMAKIWGSKILDVNRVIHEWSEACI